MDSLFAWIDTLTSFLTFWIPKLWKWISETGIAFWGLVIFVIGIAYAAVTHVVAMVALMLNVLNGIFSGTLTSTTSWHFTPPESLLAILQIANTFAPLDEFFAYLTSYGLLITALAIYRVVKNLIPTEGGA